jgi:hypothetical protein
MAYDFPNSPTVGQVYQGYVWDGQAWQVQGSAAFGAVRYDISQGLTANQAAQGRANVWVTRKNYIINGAMMISQENGATAGTTNGYYPVDMCQMSFSNAGTQTSQQVASVTPGGSPNRLRITATAADASVGSADFGLIDHPIEGLRIADLRFGSASAKTITIQFGVKAPAGTYCVALRNGTPNRSYVAEYVISGGEANTDVVKSVTVALDQTGTWATDNTVGVRVSWILMAGSTFQTTANAWAAGNFLGSSNQFNFMGTAGNTFELFDVSLTEGSVAPPFMVPDYVTELALCRRYYWDFRDFGKIAGHVSSATLVYGILYHPGMRATPTCTSSGTFTAWTANTGSAPVTTNPGTYVAGGDQSTLQWTCSGGGLVAGNISILVGAGGNIKANARL